MEKPKPPNCIGDFCTTTGSRIAVAGSAICGSCSGSSTASITGRIGRGETVSWTLTASSDLSAGTLVLQDGRVIGGLNQANIVSLLSVSNVALSYEDVAMLVAVLNKSTLSDQLVIALIYKESRFKPNENNDGAYGLMQLRQSAVAEVNRLEGTHWRHADMFNPVRNIHVGTLYLGHMVSLHGFEYGINQFYGTGPGYLDSILAASKALRDSRNPMETLRRTIGP